MKLLTPERRIRRAAGLVLLMATVAAGCGSDDSSTQAADISAASTATTTATSAAESAHASTGESTPADSTAAPGGSTAASVDSTTAPGGSTAAPGGKAVEPNGTLVVALQGDPIKMDPVFVQSLPARSIGQALFDPLLMNVEGEFVPALAEGYELVDDQTVRFALREGVTFHNGEPFDASTVAYNIERVQSPDTGTHLTPRFKNIDSVEVVDPTTVVIRLSAPDAGLLDAFTDLFMVPPVYTEEVGLEGFNAAPVGTGPFTFVSYTPDDRTVVEANRTYWVDSPKGLPLVERVEFRAIPEATTRVAELNSGGAHIAINLTPDDIERVESSGGTAVTFSNLAARFIQLNTSAAGSIAAGAGGDALAGFEALKDPNVRLALNMAIDRDAIVESYFSGLATPIGQPFAPGGLGYPSEPELYEYDPDGARELLAAAGYADGLTLQLISTPNIANDEVTLVASYLADVGVTVERETLEVSVFNERWTGGEFPHLRYVNWNTPENLLGLMVQTGGLISPYSNPAVDTLIKQQAATMDPTARAGVLDEMTAALHDDAAALYLWSPQAITGVGSGVTGWEPAASYVPVTEVQIG